jgi:hypothetical protein
MHPLGVLQDPGQPIRPLAHHSTSHPDGSTSMATPIQTHPWSTDRIVLSDMLGLPRGAEGRGTLRSTSPGGRVQPARVRATLALTALAEEPRCESRAACVEQGALAMDRNLRSLPGRLWAGFVGLLPSGGVGDHGPPPDIVGRRDADQAYRRAVLTTKSQLSSGGQATTSYEPVDRRDVGGG